MPSIISHGFWAYFFNRSVFTKDSSFKISVLVIASTMLPDADYIGYKLGIPYDSIFGHRGFTHSIVFAFIWSGFAYLLFFYQKDKFQRFLLHFTILFLATISHPILDAFTNGGHGVAFFSPFSNERYFFSYRPINASPLGISSFIGEKGLNVLRIELKYIWFPSIVLFLFSKYLSWIKK